MSILDVHQGSAVISLLTCLQAVVLRAVHRRVLGPAARPVAHRVGHPVVEADGGGLRQQWVLRQHFGPQAVSFRAGREEIKGPVASWEGWRGAEIVHMWRGSGEEGCGGLTCRNTGRREVRGKSSV